MHVVALCDIEKGDELNCSVDDPVDDHFQGTCLCRTDAILGTHLPGTHLAVPQYTICDVIVYIYLSLSIYIYITIIISV